MSTKECSPHKSKRKNTIRSTINIILIIISIIAFASLITWAILHPKKPSFIIQDATIYAFNVTTVPNLLTSNFQVTIYSRNPNSKLGIYYDKLDIYATYRSQQITYHTSLSPTYQGHKDVNVWSPFVYGTNVPVAPYNGLALCQDQASGNIQLLIKIDGLIKWKAGSIITDPYHVHVTCPALIPFGNQNTGVVVGGAIKYQLSTSCHVSV